MEQPEKLNLQSLDIKQHQLEKMKQLFPEVFTEGNKIDWDKLRLTLGEHIDAGKERFGMNWPGKADCFKTIQQPSITTLVPAREESIDFDTTQNLFIEGDNLEVLKLLQKSYLGKIKMIYIDPPYNTGNDFIYPDNFSETLETYLEYTGQVDSEGRKFSTNTETDGRFHSKWMNMMYPRLFLAKNLLKEDGVIFISIDDSELTNLKSLCNEVFGEENFMACFIWEKRTNRENRKTVSSRHDYILCYCRDTMQKEKAIKPLPMSQEALDRYKNPDNDPRGPWKSDPATAQAGHGTKGQFYILRAPNGKEHRLQSGRCWLYTEDVMKDAIRENRIWFGKDGNGVPRIKTYLDSKERALTPESLWFASDVSTNENAKKYLKELFDGIAVFETPKPIELLELIIKLGADNGIVLDFFAGSAVTAEAVLRSKNAKSFILVQLPERCLEDSQAFNSGYKTIADIAKERIRRSIKKLKEDVVASTKQAEDITTSPLELEFDSVENEVSNDTGSNEQMSIREDLGFKVFKLQPSNFNLWKSDIEKTPEAIAQQLELDINHISPEATEEAILYELLLKSGFELTTPIQKETIAGKTVYSIDGGVLLICLDKELTPAVIKGIAERKPVRVICLDEGFQNNDQLKTNAVQIMRSKNVVKFQTV